MGKMADLFPALHVVCNSSSSLPIVDPRIGSVKQALLVTASVSVLGDEKHEREC